MYANVDPVLSMLGHVGFSVTSSNVARRQLFALETFSRLAHRPGKVDSAPAGGAMSSSYWAAMPRRKTLDRRQAPLRARSGAR